MPDFNKGAGHSAQPDAHAIAVTASPREMVRMSTGRGTWRTRSSHRRIRKGLPYGGNKKHSPVRQDPPYGASYVPNEAGCNRRCVSGVLMVGREP